MSYQVLARKWRPQTFADVVGQEHIGRTLKNAILQNRIGHAYLFVGSRGIGKTTSARIFAKALNCRDLQNGEPCCKCDNCLEIAQGNSLDVIEIDGASHNKVEDIREIRDGVMYSPNKSRYKIYIIDEVHMLSTAAWNALLKTLEEPPEHVKFLFATTEPHKVLATILSRCQRFDLRRIPVPLIVQRLRQIADGEGVRVEDQALAAIARAADGGMRDAQSIFDQMIAFCGGLQEGELIREQDVIDVFGIASGSELRELALAVLANDLNRAMIVLQAMSDRGRDLERLFEDLISYVRNVMIATLCRDADRFLEVSETELEELKSLGRSLDAQLVQRVLQGLVAQEWGFRTALNKRIYLEVVLCRVITEAHSVQIDEVMTQLNVMSGILPKDQMPEPRKQLVLPPLPADISAPPAPQPATEVAAVPPFQAEAQPIPRVAEVPPPASAPQGAAAPSNEILVAVEESPVANPSSEAPQGHLSAPLISLDSPETPVQIPAPGVVEEELPAEIALADSDFISSLPPQNSAPNISQNFSEPEMEGDFQEDGLISLQEEASPVRQELTAEQLFEALLGELRKGTSQHKEFAVILSAFIPILRDPQTFVLAYDQRKVGEHEVRTVLETKNLNALKSVFKGIFPWGMLVIDRWNPAAADDLKPGLRQVNMDEMSRIAEDPFVKAFNQRMGTTVIDARVPVTKN